MDEEKPRKRQTQFTRWARAKRILERLRGGSPYDEVAHEEGLSERRVRQIVAKFLEEREPLDGAAHAGIQIARLDQAMRVASQALTRGDIRAIAPLIRVIDRLDRYEELVRRTAAKSNQADDDMVVKLLKARMMSIARAEVAEERRREALEAGAAPAEPPPAPPSPEPSPPSRAVSVFSPVIPS